MNITRFAFSSFGCTGAGYARAAGGGVWADGGGPDGGTAEMRRLPRDRQRRLCGGGRQRQFAPLGRARVRAERFARLGSGAGRSVGPVDMSTGPDVRSPRKQGLA